MRIKMAVLFHVGLVGMKYWYRTVLARDNLLMAAKEIRKCTIGFSRPEVITQSKQFEIQ